MATDEGGWWARPGWFYVRIGNHGDLREMYGNTAEAAVFELLVMGAAYVSPSQPVFVWRTENPRPDIPTVESERRRCPVGDPRVYRMAISLQEIP
jgi:hypothetical protein